MAYTISNLPRFYAVTWAVYSANREKIDPNAIYVITDLGLMYRGETLITSGVQTANVPDTGIDGVLYYTEDDGLFTFSGGTKTAVGTSADKINELIDAKLKGNEIKLDGYTTVEGSTIGISADSTITEAVTKLEEKVITIVEDIREDADIVLDEIREDADKALAELVTVLSFKDTAATVANLPAVRNYEYNAEGVVVKINGVSVGADYVDDIVYPRVGDVWHVNADGGEYVYVETTTELSSGEGDEKVVTGSTVIGHWEEFGSAVDYSNFVTTDDTDLAENKILVGSGTKKIVDSVYSAANAETAIETGSATVLANEKQVLATATALAQALFEEIQAELEWKDSMEDTEGV